MFLRPREIVFGKEYLILTDIKGRRNRIPYEELVFVYLETYSTEPGEEDCLIKPALEDITEAMDGELVMLDCRHCRWNLQTDLSGKTAGAVIRELGVYAPYILLGNQAWLNEKEEDDFDQAKKMVQIMRKCEKNK